MQLLVSVRNSTEATVAVEGGADIIDVKEPHAGALGFAGIETVTDVLSAVGLSVPVSAAMGECYEWLNRDALEDRFGNAVAKLQFMKLGLADMSESTCESEVRSDGNLVQSRLETECRWIAQWQTVRSRLSPGRSEHNKQPDWVAVAYADHQRASAPSVMEVLEAAVQTNCSTLLIDTFGKDGRGTLGWLTVRELQEVRAETRRQGLRFALAGQLTAAHLPVVRELEPDIFAVRGAVCKGDDRTATICGERVRKLRDAMKDSAS